MQEQLELRTNVRKEVLVFVEHLLPRLTEGRIEIALGSNGLMIAELVQFEPKPDSVNAP